MKWNIIYFSRTRIIFGMQDFLFLLWFDNSLFYRTEYFCAVSGSLRCGIEFKYRFNFFRSMTVLYTFNLSMRKPSLNTIRGLIKFECFRIVWNFNLTLCIFLLFRYCYLWYFRDWETYLKFLIKFQRLLQFFKVTELISLNGSYIEMPC